MATIELREISKCYENGFHAVDRISLSIPDGEFIVLVGPSGCGKSTTLRMIAGLEEISQGDLLIDGQRVNNLQPGDRDIAMVFQNYALYPHKTVRENLAFGLRMRGTSRAEIDRRIAEVAAMLSIEPLLDRRPRQLSGGQRQRVAVGRALVRQPKAFLFDEPLSNLDAKLRVQMRAEIARLHQQLRTTTVYVTHDQVEAMTLGQRIVVMKDGVIQQVDKPLHLYNRPANQFVATFIGSPAMNLITGSISGGRFVSSGMDYALGRALPAHFEGRQFVLGFRPEDIVRDDAAPILAMASIQLVERMGFETVVHYSIAGHAGVARLRGDHDLGQISTLQLRLPSTSWHLFSPDDIGSRVLSGSE